MTGIPTPTVGERFWGGLLHQSIAICLFVDIDAIYTFRVKDLNLLYVFEAMWRDRSVTDAAEQLGLTQAAVSASLKRLREEYGDKMFTLVGRRMEPTPLAVELAPQLLDALAMVRKTRVERGRFDPLTARRMFTVRTRDIGEVVCMPHILSAVTGHMVTHAP